MSRRLPISAAESALVGSRPAGRSADRLSTATTLVDVSTATGTGVHVSP